MNEEKSVPFIEEIVDRLGRVYAAVGPFDEAVAAISAHGIEVASARDIVFARMNTARDGVPPMQHSIARPSYVREGAIFIPKGPVIFVSKSPLLKDPAMAVENCRKRRETYLDDKVIRGYLMNANRDISKEPEKRSAIIINIYDNFRILTERPFSYPFSQEPDFQHHELTRWLFGDQAAEYGRRMRLHHEYVEILMPAQSYVNAQKRAFARQLHIGPLMEPFYGVAMDDSPIDANISKNLQNPNVAIRGVMKSRVF